MMPLCVTLLKSLDDEIYHMIYTQYVPPSPLAVLVVPRVKLAPLPGTYSVLVPRISSEPPPRDTPPVPAPLGLVREPFPNPG